MARAIWVGSVVALLGCVVACCCGGVKPSGRKAPPPAAVAADPIEVKVESVVVKRLGGTHRYFFRIRNEDSSQFDGTITITLHRAVGQKSGSISEEVFSTKAPMVADGVTVVFMDAYTGPTEKYGSDAIRTFRYVVKVGGGVAKEGAGEISSKYIVEE